MISYDKSFEALLSAMGMSRPKGGFASPFYRHYSYTSLPETTHQPAPPPDSGSIASSLGMWESILVKSNEDFVKFCMSRDHPSSARPSEPNSRNHSSPRYYTPLTPNHWALPFCQISITFNIQSDKLWLLSFPQSREEHTNYYPFSKVFGWPGTRIRTWLYVRGSFKLENYQSLIFL